MSEGTLTFEIGKVEKHFTFTNKKGESATGQKIWIRNDVHKYIICWSHDEYEFKEGSTIITHNLVSKEKDGVKYYSAGDKAGLEYYSKDYDDDPAEKYNKQLGDISGPTKEDATLSGHQEEDMLVIRVLVSRTKNYQKVEYEANGFSNLKHAEDYYQMMNKLAKKQLEEM